MEKRISGRTRLVALIGSPIGHSGSPAMHNYSFEKLGLDYAYLAFDTPEAKTGEAIAALKTLNMQGMNVTMPCKTAAVAYMDELSPAARIIGAVNTVVNENGRLTGYITDGEGFVRNLAEHDVSVKGKDIVVIGAGGAATAIYVQCALDGAKSISIFNIKDAFFDKTLNMIEKIKPDAPDCLVQIFDLTDTTKLRSQIDHADILINATSLGMKPNEDKTSVPDTTMFHPGLVVADVVYNPRETRLLKEAKAAGCKCIDGMGMLLWQGVAAFKLFTGQDMPVQEVQEQFFR